MTLNTPLRSGKRFGDLGGGTCDLRLEERNRSLRSALPTGPFDTEFFHSRFQRRGLQLQNRRRSPRTTYLPPRFFQRSEDVVTLHRF